MYSFKQQPIALYRKNYVPGTDAGISTGAGDGGLSDPFSDVNAPHPGIRNQQLPQRLIDRPNVQVCVERGGDYKFARWMERQCVDSRSMACPARCLELQTGIRTKPITRAIISYRLLGYIVEEKLSARLRKTVSNGTLQLFPRTYISRNKKRAIR
jgi:hypothetical protein